MQALISIVLPVFAIVAAGYVCGWKGLLGADSSEALNKFVYWIALPALLFAAMANVDLAQALNWPYLAAFTGALVATWLISALIARAVFKLSMGECALHGLNGSYANTGYIGIPLAIAAYGEEAALPAILATVISVLAVGLAAIPIELERRQAGEVLALLREVFLALCRNPMLVAPLAGLAWAALGLPMPAPVKTFTDILGAAAGPCALVAIGLFLVGKPLTEGTAELAVMTVTKLVVHPALTALAILVVFPVSPLWSKVAILCAALPVGSGPFVLAQAHGIYVRRTSTVMLVTTALGVVTASVFFLIFPIGA
jgi:malonate transporter